MSSIKLSVRRAGSLFAAAALVLSAAVPALVSAATVTERSIALSSSVAEATDVSYDVNFTSPSATKTFVATFCTTPADSCTAPTGLNLSGATTATTDYTVANKTANTVAVELTNASTTVSVVIDDVVNPEAGTMYARIATYAEAYASLGSVVDTGNVAIAITSGFSVDTAVLEELTFCISGVDEGTDYCTDPDTVDGTLGTDGVLGTSIGDDVDVYSYIATNANGGAVVSLKSDAEGCGGLLLEGTGSAADRCNISPLTTAGAIADNAAVFGAKLALTQPAGSAGQLALVGDWNATNYYMNYVNGDASGVTSPYGDPIYNTNDEPTDWGSAQLSFNANRSNLTPAGNYSANFSLIATGKF